MKQSRARLRAILLFARAPEAEARAKGLSDRRAVTLFQAVASGWARAAWNAGASLIVCCDPRHEASLLRATGPGALTVPQRGANFGDRLANAAADSFAAGATELLLVGIDSPQPPSVLIEKAFGSLERRVPVIGPAADGGVYLIGIARPERELLQSIRLRDPGVANLCLRSFSSSALHLPESSDLDSPVDLSGIWRDELWASYAEIFGTGPIAPVPATIKCRPALLTREPSRAPPRPV